MKKKPGRDSGWQVWPGCRIWPFLGTGFGKSRFIVRELILKFNIVNKSKTLFNQF